MDDETLGTAQVEIVASLDGLQAGLAQAQDELSDSVNTLGESASQAGALFESVFDSAGSRMLDAAVSAGQAKDAWLSLGDAALGLADDVEKAILELTVLDPLLNSLFGGEAGGPLPTLGGTSFGGLFESIGQSLPGAAAGGAFDVGSAAGVDAQMALLRDAPGEHLSIGSSSDRGPVGGVTNVTVNNHTGAPAGVAHQSNAQGGEDVTVTIGKVVARDIRTNGPAGQALRQHYGASVVPIQR